MEKVAYIIQTKNNNFKGFIALLTPDGDDSALFPIHHTNKFEKLEEAQKELENLPPDVELFINPIKPNNTGLSWLSELKAANK